MRGNCEDLSVKYLISLLQNKNDCGCCILDSMGFCNPGIYNQNVNTHLCSFRNCSCRKELLLYKIHFYAKLLQDVPQLLHGIEYTHNTYCSISFLLQLYQAGNYNARSEYVYQ